MTALLHPTLRLQRESERHPSVECSFRTTCGRLNAARFPFLPLCPVLSLPQRTKVKKMASAQASRGNDAQQQQQQGQGCEDIDSFQASLRRRLPRTCSLRPLVRHG